MQLWLLHLPLPTSDISSKCDQLTIVLFPGVEPSGNSHVITQFLLYYLFITLHYVHTLGCHSCQMRLLTQSFVGVLDDSPFQYTDKIIWRPRSYMLGALAIFKIKVL